MLVTKAARRYASALFQIAREQNEVNEVLANIKLIKQTLADSRELVNFLRSPIIKFDDKKEVLDAIFKDKVQPIVRTFLELLAKKKRANLLDQVTEAFFEQYHKQEDITKVSVYAARDLSNSQLKALKEALEQKTDLKVDLELTIDPSLKAGLAVRIEDTVIDGTVKRKLEQLESTLLETAAD